MNIWLKILFGLLFVCQGGQAQPFLNLNFESAKIIPDPESPYYPYGIAISNALPDWDVTLAGEQTTQITYNDPSAGAAFVTLLATNGSQISGNYSVLLTGGIAGGSASISQTALVPVTEHSLLFEAQPGFGSLTVSVGGNNLSFFVISTEANYTLYGADISNFAGQTEQLTFSALGDTQILNDWNIDGIQFSPLPVPEPGVLGLSAMGGLLLAWRRGRKHFQI